jgi:integrase/recombinase XerD
MLTTYRRHRQACEHRTEGRKYRRCRCPIWVDGFLGDLEIRQSLATGDWEKAQQTIRAWEAAGEQIGEKTEPITIKQATDEFLADAQARKLNERTIYKYRFLFDRLTTFADLEGVRFLKQLDTATLRKFRTTWKDNNLAALKKLERLRSFFRFANDSGWLADNPAQKLSSPRVKARPTLPFSHQEMIRILAAASMLIDESEPPGRDNARRLRALVLLLRYTGLRIGDAVSCSLERFSEGRVRLYTQKTGTHVHCPLPEFVIKELDALAKKSDQHWFWTANCKLKTAVTDWQARLRVLFEDAKVPNGHAHRFRDTFAVELLLDGVPLERVSVLLGHTSIRVTEKHYSPWVRERQEQAEADIRGTWAKDPVVLLETKGTLEVHGTTEPVN